VADQGQGATPEAAQDGNGAAQEETIRDASAMNRRPGGWTM